MISNKPGPLSFASSIIICLYHSNYKTTNWRLIVFEFSLTLLVRLIDCIRIIAVKYFGHWGLPDCIQIIAVGAPLIGAMPKIIQGLPDRIRIIA